MGCRLSKNEAEIAPEIVDISSEADMDSKSIDYKARLERKMCLAKETPEPIFDLSECNLKVIPSGVFIHCRILRKEILNLSKNKLQFFKCNSNNNTSGFLNDLTLLRILDLRYNSINQLPDEIYKIENLRELLVSNNKLIKLPQTINSLKYLELLDVSNNNLQNINEINCMPSLRILNLSGNKNLKRIPTTLATCDNLCDLILIDENIEWPPNHIIQSGTAAIMQFLLTGESSGISDSRPNHTNIMSKPLNEENPSDALIRELQIRDRKLNEVNKMKYQQFNDSDYGNENVLLEALQKRQLEQKQQLLKAVLEQQTENETLVNKLHQQKDSERNKLIEDIMQAEDSANIVIDNFLAFKNKSDSALIEKERFEEERLLEKLHLQHSDLRKQEVVATMLEVLRDEEMKIQSYHEKRNANSMDILERENETTAQLGVFYRNYEKNRNDIIDKICVDEELQKQAVANLISKNDARSWGLVEQLKIVETQLAGMTQLELERKKFSNVEQINALADKRLRLTYILMDLLEQQEARKKQLLDTLCNIEAQKSSEQQDFWLLQYQRLLDSRPLEFSMKSCSIDPLLGYHFLVNGVIHCLPFLQKLWNSNEVFLENLNDDHLRASGIRDEKDRRLILKSIQDFLKESNNCHTKVESDRDDCQPSEPSLPEIETVNNTDKSLKPSTSEEKTGDSSEDNTINNASECVICMEEFVKVIFLPCGHMCCCLNCQLKVEICPMCRADIERKVKVVQS